MKLGRAETIAEEWDRFVREVLTPSGITERLHERDLRWCFYAGATASFEAIFDPEDHEEPDPEPNPDRLLAIATELTEFEADMLRRLAAATKKKK